MQGNSLRWRCNPWIPGQPPPSTRALPGALLGSRSASWTDSLESSILQATSGVGQRDSAASPLLRRRGMRTSRSTNPLSAPSTLLASIGQSGNSRVPHGHDPDSIVVSQLPPRVGGICSLANLALADSYRVI